MLKIEVIKFEAQDVITASTAAIEPEKKVCICPEIYSGICEIHSKCPGNPDGSHNCDDIVN